MKRYLFLTGWVTGSEGAGYEDTGIKSQDDLLEEYLAVNENVFALRIDAPNLDIATMCGRAEAWDENYTGYDTVSTCFELTEDYGVGDSEETRLIVVDCTEK